ncbi:MAG: IS21 family transposase [Anaerolineae bacterium]|nr:IS21 family transposase [Anaerolineae bacterium]
MLKVEDRFMIKEMYRRGMTISDIARTTGHDRKTIRAIVNGPVSPAPQKREPRAKRLDPFVPYLERRIEEGVLNCNKLWDELRKQGYEGGKSLVKSFVQPYREARRQEATMRFETPPGEQAQVDWGHFGFIEHHGHRRRLYAFVMTLGWSRASYLEFTVSADAAWWLRCHVHAFRYFGGVPQIVLHDNLKTAVLERDADGTIHWNPRYLDFGDYYGFAPRPCQPYRAQTKGKVESGIRYVRGNFWPGLRFVDLGDLNQQARAWLDGTANVRVHGTTGEVPFRRLPLERLQSMDSKPDYDTSLIVFRRVSKDCLVSYDGNYYSVPWEYARKTVELKETEDGQLIVLNAEDDEIARHRVVDGHNQRVVVAAHYENIRHSSRPARRSVAIQVPRPDDGLPPAPEVEVRPLCWYDQVVEAVE